MSRISDQRDSIMALIDAATGITSSKWDGDPVAFAPQTLPAIGVMCEGGVEGESEEIGGPGCVSVFLNYFLVLVAAEDSGDEAAGDQIFNIIEQISAALNETDVAVPLETGTHDEEGEPVTGESDPDAAICRPYRHPQFGGHTWSYIAGQGGRASYVQAWKVEQIIDI